MSTKQGERRVKRWAIVDKVSGVIESADYFARNECPASEETNAEAIYNNRKSAKQMLIPDNHKIIPITIHYSLPPQ